MYFDNGFKDDERFDIGVNVPLSRLSILPNNIWDADIFNLSLWLELRILCANGRDFYNQLKSEHVSVD